MILDRFGVPQTASDPAAVRAYDVALGKLLVLNDDPLAEIDNAIALDPGFTMAQVFKGLLGVLGTDRAGVPMATTALTAARASLGDSSKSGLRRERLHVAALEAWLERRPAAACDLWETLLVEEPRDALAMFAAHQTDFFLGHTAQLRDRVARRLGALEPGSRLAGYYNGMHAFGLEETGDYAGAEEAAHAALASDRRDAWAIHAAAHVYEMTNRLEEGTAWLSERLDDWTRENFFSTHLAWHWALYHLDREHFDAALAIYDERFPDGRLQTGKAGVTVLDLVDGTSLLWRLQLQNVPVGARWATLAAAWEPHVADAWYAFNDMHAMMAFAGAGNDATAQALLATMAASASGESANARATRRVALPVARALLAYAHGRYGEAVDLLEPVTALAPQAGGSHAQRDVIEQTLLAAAVKAGRNEIARPLAAARLARKPRSALNRTWLERAAQELAQ